MSSEQENMSNVKESSVSPSQSQATTNKGITYEK